MVLVCNPLKAVRVVHLGKVVPVVQRMLIITTAVVHKVCFRISGVNFGLWLNMTSLVSVEIYPSVDLVGATVAPSSTGR